MKFVLNETVNILQKQSVKFTLLRLLHKIYPNEEVDNSGIYKIAMQTIFFK